MSQVKIQGDVGGTGTITLAAPKTNSNRTINLPDASGTALLDTSNLTTQVMAATNASGTAPIYACRAWVNFNGTATEEAEAQRQAIRDKYAVIQQNIDAAQTPEGIKAALEGASPDAPAP